LTKNNADDAIKWFGELAASYLQEKKFTKDLVFIPVPNRKALRSNSVLPRTLLLAKAIAERLDDAKVFDCLRWEKPMEKRIRDPRFLYENLAFIGRRIPEGTPILVDDVRTTGAHLLAAAAKLKDKGVRCKRAITCGRTPLQQESAPFSVLEEELPEFTP
jgi:predicted amidophosphoribosyltransferase